MDYVRFLGPRTDILLGGLNTELTNYGTYIRRPGFLLYTANTYDTPIYDFYSFQQVKNVYNPIDVIIDAGSTIKKIDPVNGDILIRNKFAGVGQAYFQGVGNNLYLNDQHFPSVWNDPSVGFAGTCTVTNSSSARVLTANAGGSANYASSSVEISGVGDKGDIVYIIFSVTGSDLPTAPSGLTLVDTISGTYTIIGIYSGTLTENGQDYTFDIPTGSQTSSGYAFISYTPTDVGSVAFYHGSVTLASGSSPTATTSYGTAGLPGDPSGYGITAALLVPDNNDGTAFFSPAGISAVSPDAFINSITTAAVQVNAYIDATSSNDYNTPTSPYEIVVTGASGAEITDTAGIFALVQIYGISESVSTVTWESSTNGNQYSGFDPSGAWNGQPITIDGTAYTIATVTSPTTLTLTSGATANSDVSYVGPPTRNWGIAMNTLSSATGPSGPATGTDVTVKNGTAWTNPGNITESDQNFATVQPGSSSDQNTGATNPQTSSQGTNGTVWSNASGITSDDSSTPATANTTPTNNSTAVIQGTNYGFNIPPTATILGIEIAITAKYSVTGGDNTVYKPSVSLLGVTGNVVAGACCLTTSYASYTFGSSTDTWGITSAALVPATFNSSNFGAAMTFSQTSTANEGNCTTSIYDMTITVYYNSNATAQSDYLEATNFGFDLSSSATISGIQVGIEGYQSATGDDISLSVQLLKGGQPVGTIVANQNLPEGSEASDEGYIYIGGATNTWGTTWAPTDINNSGFGVAIQAFNSTSTNVEFYVDYVTITFWGSGSGPTVTSTSGTLSPANGGYSYCFAYGNSNAGPGVNGAGNLSSCTPVSAYTGNATDVSYEVTLESSTDPQVNQIWVFRTTDGGATYYNLPTSPYANTDQTITDSAQDVDLAITQQAPLNFVNNPPLAGLTAFAFYAGSVWGCLGNLLYFSSGPACTLGNGSETFPPANYLTFPSDITRIVPTSNGMLVFTLTDTWLLGGTSLATYYQLPYQYGLGLLNYNALDVQGSNIFLFTADKQAVSINSSGVTTLGFAIGNLLETIDPSEALVSAIISGVAEQAVYVSDGASYWYRCNWNQPPEGGPAWSPQAVITNGITAMTTMETSPGNFQIMIGNNSGQVQVRTLNTFTDNGTAYDANIIMGSIVLCQPGQLCEVESITIEGPNIVGASAPTLSVLIDEIYGIAGTVTPTFETLSNYVVDPPVLVPSQTVQALRYYLIQGGSAIDCRHITTQLDWGTQVVQNELYTLSVYGALKERDF